MSALDAILSNFVVTEDKWAVARKELADLRSSIAELEKAVEEAKRMYRKYFNGHFEFDLWMEEYGKETK